MNDDMTPGETPAAGMDRRSLIKRSAVVGGALVWTTPIVQSIAGPAFGATGSDTGGQGGVCTQSFAFKNDRVGDTTTGAFDLEGVGNGTKCLDPNTAGVPYSFVGIKSLTYEDSEEVAGEGFTAVRITLLPGYRLTSARTKAANQEGDSCPDVEVSPTPVSGTLATGFTYVIISDEIMNSISHITGVICLVGPATP